MLLEETSAAQLGTWKENGAGVREMKAVFSSYSGTEDILDFKMLVFYGDENTDFSTGTKGDLILALWLIAVLLNSF